MIIRTTVDETVLPVFKVYDAVGNPIDFIEYDTETQEVTMEIPVRSRWAAHFKFVSIEHSVDGKPEPLTLCFRVSGSYATRDGDRV